MASHLDLCGPGQTHAAAPIVIDQPGTVLECGGHVLSGHGLVVTAPNVVVCNLTIRNCAGDGVQFLGGARDCTLVNVTLDNSGVHPDYGDEAISVVHGATNIWISRCTIRGWGKAILIGCGDPEWREAEADATVIIGSTIFEGCGRRHPYVRYGTVEMGDCTIRDWGRAWSVKSYGVRAEDGAVVRMTGCRFEQRPFWQAAANPWRLVKELAQGCGPHKAIKTASGGKIILSKCTKNRSWINAPV